jgi:threonylcarbamoyladenosine tRNA methylthiotransferase MtaB
VCADAPRVEVRTLGCKVNRSESEALAEALVRAGVVVSMGGEPADAVVVNTCSVTGEADAKARKEVRRALGATSGPVVVTGCLASLDADGLCSIGDRVVVAADRVSVAATVALLVHAPGRSPDECPDIRSVAASTPHRTRALVKVQDGCDNRCAYCIVPDARGAPRSIPTVDIVAGVAALHAAGTAEVVLTGVNIGRYRDDGGARDLAALLRDIAATGIRRIRVSSIEPPDVTDALLEVMAATPSIAAHLHLPVQAGSDRTLSAMGRRYDTAGFADVLRRVRRALPRVQVTTDVIAGFPGESDEDFLASSAFVEACGFSKLHVFRYSRRAGTPAAAASGQVAPAVKAARAAALRDLSARLERAHAERRAGGPAMLLVERVRDGIAFGTTEDHLRVVSALADVVPGQLVPVVIGAACNSASRGYYVGVERARLLTRAPH